MNRVAVLCLLLCGCSHNYVGRTVEIEVPTFGCVHVQQATKLAKLHRVQRPISESDAAAISSFTEQLALADEGKMLLPTSTHEITEVSEVSDEVTLIKLSGKWWVPYWANGEWTNPKFVD